MVITLEQLKQLLPGNKHLEYWHAVLIKLLPEYGIDTPRRIAAFIAQCAHESGNFNILKENLNYKPETLIKIFPKYFPTDEMANRYASLPNKQEAIANLVYANRMGNGGPETGDGYRYCGRGLIQLTGKANYLEFSEFSKISFSDIIKYLETFDGAVHSACWFWQKHDLNSYSDKNDILGQTVKINGGKKGLVDRSKRYVNYKKILYGK